MKIAVDAMGGDYAPGVVVEGLAIALTDFPEYDFVLVGHAEKLAFLTDIEGVYRDPQDPSTLISKLFVKEARELINSGNVGGGMIPKLQNCVDAIEGGVSRVHILDGRIKHCLLLEIFTDKGIGTAILRKDGIQYYDV